MRIQTIEFKDIRENDFRIRVLPEDLTDRVKTTTTPNGLWFHYDVNKYTLEEAKQMLTDSYIQLHNELIADSSAKIAAILDYNKKGN